MRAATVLFGVSGGSIPAALVDVVTKVAIPMATGSMSMLVLVPGMILGPAIGKGAFSAVVFIVRTAAGLVYLTVDLTMRGAFGATKAIANTLYEALPNTSPPPAHWDIQDNYKPTKRASQHPPEPKSLGAARDPVLIDPKEVAKLAGDESLASSFVQLPEDQIAAILGHSKRYSIAPPAPSLVATSSAIAESSHYSPSPARQSSQIQCPAPVAPKSPLLPAIEDDEEYPVGTVSQDALAGFLGQSLRQVQQRQEANPSMKLSSEEIEEMILADPTFAAPQGAPEGYAAKKLEQSVDLHASRLRKRDPIVDSWMNVSAPMIGE
jgi:hypothetical protein